jgi:hypothetical protein
MWWVRSGPLPRELGQEITMFFGPVDAPLRSRSLRDPIALKKEKMV